MLAAPTSTTETPGTDSGALITSLSAGTARGGYPGLLGTSSAPRIFGRYPVTCQSGSSFYEGIRGRDLRCISESARNLQAKARLYKPMRSTLFCIPSSGLILREVRGLPDRRVNVRSYSEPSGSIHCYAIRAAFCGRIGASDDLRGVA
jgi:hypothetical protein